MKRIFFALAVVAFVFASCADINVVENKDPKAISFQTMVAKVTKANAITGNTVPTDSLIYAAATYRTLDGDIVDPNFMKLGGQLVKDATMWLAHDGTKWNFNDGAFKTLYYPLNGKLDFLACVPEKVDDGVWKQSTKLADLTYDSASGLTVEEIDTRDNQHDFLWAASNDNTADNGPVVLNFNHAQAMIVFNVMRENEDFVKAKAAYMAKLEAWKTTNGATEKTETIGGVDYIYTDEWLTAKGYSLTDTDIENKLKEYAAEKLAAVGVEPDDSDLKYLIIDDIAFYDYDEFVKTTPYGTIFDPATEDENYVTLKNKGTFVVNNERKKAVAQWKGLEVKKGTIAQVGAMKAFSEVYDADVLAADFNKFDYQIKVEDATAPYIKDENKTAAISTRVNYSNETEQDALTVGEFKQLGASILIPQQEMQNFIVFYHFPGEAAYSRNIEMNGPRGVWKMGYKYLYNIRIPASGPITFEISVNPFEDGKAYDYNFNIPQAY